MAETTNKWPDLAGRIEGGRHILPVRVYHEDTDFSGFVYHASYVRYCERGRSDWLRLLGVDHDQLFDGGKVGQGAVFAVRHLAIDYLRPARIDDLLEVVTACTELGAATITLGQEVRRGDETLTTLTVKVVLLDMNGRPKRLGPHLRNAIAAQCGDS